MEPLILSQENSVILYFHQANRAKVGQGYEESKYKIWVNGIQFARYSSNEIGDKVWDQFCEAIRNNAEFSFPREEDVE